MKFTRRDFIKASSLYAGIQILPSHVWANSPNSKFCTAHIGVGGKGWSDLQGTARHPMVRVVGLADVDRSALDHERTQPYQDVVRFADFREMLNTLGDKVDGVVVSTPDHTHYPATLMAMNMGKPVYCQKPLTHEIAEAYELQKLAQQKKLVTQMGIQLHSSIGNRMAVHFLQSGIIGKVSKVYVWSHKSWGDDASPYTGSDPVPEGLDWNLWLGTAPSRPFLKGKYHPGNWRKILDFGCGTLGDMGAHIFDTPYAALKMGLPLSVKVNCREPNNFSHPGSNTVEFDFAGTEYTTDTLHMTWFDGDHSPQNKKQEKQQDNPDLQLEEGKKLPNQGAMFIGEEGKRLLLPLDAAPQPLPRSLLANVKKPDLEPINHHHQWTDACHGKGSCGADFDYAAPLTVAILQGMVGSRFPGQKLQWDGANMQFTNHAEANKLVRRTYRTDY